MAAGTEVVGATRLCGVRHLEPSMIPLTARACVNPPCQDLLCCDLAARLSVRSFKSFKPEANRLTGHSPSGVLPALSDYYTVIGS